MSENSQDLTASRENGKVEPDFFGFYVSEVARLLIQDEDFCPFTLQSSHKAGKNGSSDSSPLYSNGIGALHSEFKNERLKSLLRQSVFTLTPEVDEIVNPILSLCRIKSCLKYKESLLRMDASARKTDRSQCPPKKCKIASSSSDSQCKNGLLAIPGKESSDDYKNKSIQCNANGTSCRIQIDDDLRCILENDSTKVESLIKTHSNEFLTTLQNMEQKLEQLLNTVMTSCRPMTLSEKQRLRKFIQNLPSNALDRVLDIIKQKDTSDAYSTDEVHVELDELDKVTLWRLYFFVKTVNN